VVRSSFGQPVSEPNEKPDGGEHEQGQECIRGEDRRCSHAGSLQRLRETTVSGR
jgi:hypothetical protein